MIIYIVYYQGDMEERRIFPTYHSTKMGALKECSKRITDCVDRDNTIMVNSGIMIETIEVDEDE
jgi:hypothetical protein